MISKRHLLGGLASLGLAPAAFAAGRELPGTPRLLLGPMLGPVVPDGATVWGMASAEVPVALEYSADRGMTRPARSRPVVPRREDGYTFRITQDGLLPGREYFYRVLVNGAPDKYLQGMPPGRFRTAPPPGQAAPWRLAFGSCARIQADARQAVWQGVSAREPDLFLWLGDNVYVDALSALVFDVEYRRQRAVPAFQPVARDVSQLAIWDDHDFGLNNHDRTNPVKETALAAFRRYWPNPAFGRSDAPGVYFSYRYGAVELFCLDGRYHRDPNEAPDQPGKTMLGEAQLAWLQEGLAASDAVFKVLACGSGWSMAKGAGGDSWASFLHERTRLFDFIRDANVEGVVLISGDTHVAELNAIPEAQRGGYDLYELVSSPLAQQPTQSWLERTPDRRLRTPFNMDNNFGMLTFRFDGEPEVALDVFDSRGRRAWPSTRLRARDLVNGAPSRLEDLVR